MGNKIPASIIVIQKWSLQLLRTILSSKIQIISQFGATLHVTSRQRFSSCGNYAKRVEPCSLQPLLLGSSPSPRPQAQPAVTSSVRMSLLIPPSPYPRFVPKENSQSLLCVPLYFAHTRNKEPRMGKPLPAHCEWFIAPSHLAWTSFKVDYQLIRISTMYPEYLTAKVLQEIITEMMIKITDGVCSGHLSAQHT